MSIICPTILADSPDAYKAQIENLHPFAERVQIDISDGEFAPHHTVGMEQVWWPKEWLADIHAMVMRPSEHLETIISLKPHMVIFHAETQEDIIPILAHVKKFDIKVGIALLKQTVPNLIKEAIQIADHALIFSGDLGKFGGNANLLQLEKVRLIKNINSNIEIGWDGGANLENVYGISKGGIDVINVGGYIANAQDPKAAYDSLVSEINNRHGVV